MLWTIAAPFFTRSDARWIDDAVPEGPDSFHKVAVPGSDDVSWHDRPTRATPVTTWLRHWRHSAAALRSGDGLITVFPQLAFTAAMQRRRNHQIVAWCFNIGAYPAGVRGWIARRVLRSIDHFVVHSRGEVGLLRDWLDLGEGRVSFVPLQRAPIPILAAEDQEQPFALAMGSANRDYPALLEAARICGLPLTIVAAPRLFEGLSMPENVTLLSSLSAEECWRLAQRARLSIVPLADVGAASGQITVVEALRMGRPLIATRTIGTVDYVAHDENGLLVAPSDPVALAAAMERLWHDRAARERLAAAGAAFAEASLSDETAAQSLLKILRQVQAGSA